MSQLLLLLLSTCVLETSAQAEVITRFQVETADDIAEIIEKLAPIKQAILHFKEEQVSLQDVVGQIYLRQTTLLQC